MNVELRDYMAIHSTQPGCNEIVAMAGLVFSNNQVWLPNDPNKPIGPFNSWYNSLPLTQQLDLCAKVKYAQADAMLRVRKL